jgi:hypothetical protein
VSPRRTRVIAGAGIVAACAAVGVAALVAASREPVGAPQPPSVAPAKAPAFPAPPRGAVVFAREDRTDVLALAVLPQPGGLLVRTSLVGQQGEGMRGLRVTLTVRGRSSQQKRLARACGAGCYGATLPLRSPPRSVRVDVRRAARTTIWNVQLPVDWPARDASALVARATRVWKRLRSLTYTDRLSSGPEHTLVSHWRVVAPDRLAYRIEGGGGEAVIIGRTRWDRSEGGGWSKSPALRLRQPQPFWVAAVDAHIIGSGRIGARPVWRVSFFDPKTPGWFVASIDKGNARTLDVRMWATAHFMHDTYGHFNAPIAIVPPL